MRGQRGALEVREHASERAPQPASSALRSARSGPTRIGGGDHELGQVDVERRLRSADRGRGEVDQHRAVVHHEHVARVQTAVRDPRPLETGDLLPQVREHLVATPPPAEDARAARRQVPPWRSGRRRSVRAPPSRPVARARPACAAMRVASAWCSTCSSRRRARSSEGRGRRASASGARCAGCPARRARAPGCVVGAGSCRARRSPLLRCAAGRPA